MDIFYYLHRGYDFEFIHRAMPSLSREQFNAIVEYVSQHYQALVEEDARVEQFHERQSAAQRARGGIFSASDENLSTAERVARLKVKMARQSKPARSV
jgi:Lhr-like helicase